MDFVFSGLEATGGGGASSSASGWSVRLLTDCSGSFLTGSGLSGSCGGGIVGAGGWDTSLMGT